MKKIVIQIIIIHILFLTTLMFATDKKVQFDSNYFLAFKRLQPILRDEFLLEQLNEIILCKGKILSVDKFRRYNKKYRVMLQDTSALKYNITITYYLFFDNHDIYTQLKKDSLYEFSGQLMTVTPLEINRDSFIIDIILGTGAVVLH